MPEGGLSTSEVGKHIAEHAEGANETHDRHGWVIAVFEASLLALVAVLAAWSGFSSAKWGTESRLKLSQAATARARFLLVLFLVVVVAAALFIVVRTIRRQR